MENILRIHIGADHAGFEMKTILKKWLEDHHYEVIDYGADEYNEDDDYPDFCSKVAQAVRLDENSRGVVIGGSGQGEAIVCNRYPDIRAVVFNGQYEPKDGRETPNEIIVARQHNDSNVISFGARFISEDEAIEALELWLETAFSEEDRHVRRIHKIEQLNI
jgi:ribose 5-phosphate isomerase B